MAKQLKWSDKDIATFLMLKNAQCARAGKPCPVAARVLERIEAKMEAEAARTE